MAHEGHDHGHSHDHDHATGSRHEASPSSTVSCDPGPAQISHASSVPGHAPARAELERGSGLGRILFLDAPSGLAGDMIIAALVDLGVPARVIADALATLTLTGFHVEFGSRVRSGIVAGSFEVHVDAAQPPRTYAQIRDLLDASTLADGVKTRAHRTFLRLAAAEAKVHASTLEEVHFHEVGAIDAIADVVGSAAAIEYLGAEMWVSPLPIGRGFVRASHGVLPLPAPATVECLAGLATYDGGLDFEFVTPTGAAIVGAHAAGSSRWPSMAPVRTGWGAGSANLSDRPNVLRAVLGKVEATAERRADATHTVLEANIDDASGELAGHWIEALLASGALDAWATPITMKKGRPAITLSALAPREHADAVAYAMLRETTSLGVRRTDVSRAERPRTIETVATAFGPIPVKVARGPFGPPQVKPEFDACVQAARDHGVPVREVLRAALAAAAERDDSSMPSSKR